MTDEQNIAYQNAMTACAIIKAQEMTAENMQHCHLEQLTAKDFFNLIDEYGIHYNAVIKNLTGL